MSDSYVPPNLQRPNPTQINTAEPTPVVPSTPSLASAPAPKRPVTREKRQPFGSQVQKLAYEARAGYHRHWFNDSPGRIEQALAAGYTHVEDKEGKKVSRVVGVGPSGGALLGFLMETPQEWYDEDMAAQQKIVDEREAAIKRGESDRQAGDGRYIPSQGIKISHG